MPSIHVPIRTVTWDPGFKQLASAQFWTDVLERAVRSFIWVFVPALGLTSISAGTDILHLPWLTALLFAAVPTAGAVLTSIASALRKGSDPDSGSFLKRDLPVLIVPPVPPIPAPKPYTGEDVERLRGGFVSGVAEGLDLSGIYVPVLPDTSAAEASFQDAIKRGDISHGAHEASEEVPPTTPLAAYKDDAKPDS